MLMNNDRNDLFSKTMSGKYQLAVHLFICQFDGGVLSLSLRAI